MAESPGPIYKISYTPQITKQLLEIKERADQLGILQAVRNTLIQIISELKKKPLEWGDPRYLTKLKGGMVFFGIRKPLGIEYVVYEKQKVVWVLNLIFYPPMASKGNGQ